MSGLSAKKDKHFVETKVFKVSDPSGAYVLTDENGAPFTVEMYAPQSQRMRDYGKEAAKRQLLRSARTNGASDRNIELAMKSQAHTLSHAIKAWHPVSPDGEFLAQYANMSEKDRAELFNPPDDPDADISWLVDQLQEFFSRGNFVVTAELPKETTTTTKAAS